MNSPDRLNKVKGEIPFALTVVQDWQLTEEDAEVLQKRVNTWAKLNQIVPDQDCSKYLSRPLGRIRRP